MTASNPATAEGKRAVHSSTPKALNVAAPSQYVLEIGGGLSARYGIRAGQAVDFQAGGTAK